MIFIYKLSNIIFIKKVFLLIIEFYKIALYLHN